MAKTKRSVYHVTPKKGGGWNVKKEGNQKASGTFDKKTDAVAQGKSLAKKAPLGQIKIHKQDGTIQTEYTYGKDPYPPKG
jgi:Uncharacterized protein conserved in bacteria (DUF2188)